MFANRERPRWSFYLLWIVLTALCIPITFIAAFAILRLIILLVGDYVTVGGVRHITEDYLWSFVFYPMAGLVTGIVQYALLRRYLPRMGWWVAATTGGWLMVLLGIALAGWLQWTRSLSSWFWLPVVLGVIMGAVQWMLLRRRLPQAGWWIAASAAGWALWGLLTGATSSFGMFGLWTLGAVPAVATALMLALLMNQGQQVQAQAA